ncbi:MAG: hypothetical protein ACRDGM_09760 [bacterium]
MEVRANSKEWRVEIRLGSDSEEASYVYDLMQSGRLLVENKELLPLPFRGQFLFKLPARPRPIPIQVGRFEATAEEVLAGKPGLALLVSTARGPSEFLDELASALRDVPPASEEEFKADTTSHLDEYARVRSLNHAQKVIYATRAGQTGRAILMQQPNPLLLLYLCKNPLITLPEIIQIARLPGIDALVAEYLVRMLRSNPQLAMSEELKLALCTNAKTPGGTALSLLKGLTSRNLRHIAKQGEVRGSLKQAALRILSDRRE